MALGGDDLVFGVEWLKHLGLITTDYSSITMSFTWGNELVELQGCTGPDPTELTHTQVKHLLHIDRVTAFFHLQLCTTYVASSEPLPPRLQLPLEIFSPLFQQPTKLSPAQPIDHTIHLIPNSQPINVKPYCYLYFQKHEIEKQVKDMLHRNHMQPSRIPYSSPVLLVKKKNGTWCFCVDYRALNTITVKDHFPLPTIDELLDDLGHATWFSKLDLAQGFHQIHMAPMDVSKTAFRTHHGHFEYNIVSFAIYNAPSTF